MNLLFFECSAKTGQNIKGLFNELAKKLTGIETITNTDQEKTGGFKLNDATPANDAGEGDDGATKKKKKRGCC